MPNLEDHGIGGSSVKGIKTIDTFTLDDTLKVGDIAYQVTHDSRSVINQSKLITNNITNMETISCNTIKVGKFVISSYKQASVLSLHMLVHNVETGSYGGTTLAKNLGASPNSFAGVRKLLKIDDTSFYLVFSRSDGSTVWTNIQYWTIDSSGVLTLKNELSEAGQCYVTSNSWHIRGTKLIGALQRPSGTLELSAKIFDIVGGVLTKVTDFTCPSRFYSATIASFLTSNDHLVIAGRINNGSVFGLGLVILKLTGNIFTVMKDATTSQIFHTGSASNGFTDPYLLVETNDGVGVLANYYTGSSSSLNYGACKIDYSTYVITNNGNYMSIGDFHDGTSTPWHLLKSWKNMHLIKTDSSTLLVTATTQKILAGTQYRVDYMRQGTGYSSFGGVDGNNGIALSYSSPALSYIEKPLGLHQFVANSLSIDGAINRVEKVGPSTFVYTTIVNNNTKYMGAFRIEPDGSITKGTTIANMGTYTQNDVQFERLINLNILRGNDAHLVTGHYSNGNTNTHHLRLCRVNLSTLDVAAGPIVSISQSSGNMFVSKITETAIFTALTNTSGNTFNSYTWNLDFSALSLTQVGNYTTVGVTGLSTGDGSDFHMLPNNINGANTMINVFFKSNSSGTYYGQIQIPVNTTTLAIGAPVSWSSNYSISSDFGYTFDKDTRLIRQIHVDAQGYYNYETVWVADPISAPVQVTGVDKIFDYGTGGGNRLGSIKGSNIAILQREESQQSYLWENALAMFGTSDNFDDSIFIPSFRGLLDRVYNNRLNVTDDGKLVHYSLNTWTNTISVINILNPMTVKKAKSQRPVGIVTSVNGNKVKVKTFAS